MNGPVFEALVTQVTDVLMSRLEQQDKPVLLVLEATLNPTELARLSAVFRVTSCCATDEADVILCGLLPLTRLARLAKIVPQAGEETLCEHLLAGKPLIMLTSQTVLASIRKTARYALYQEVQQINVTLERYGVTFVTRNECCEVILQQRLKRKLFSTGAPKAVLTAQRVQALVAEGATEISCSQQTIVTALAHDYLRENKIMLTFT
ncbi:hypothetical protein [Brochothrix campestris]|uniref:Ethanolamine utilization protein n=1 Tax=Brochothrix campestris FSL F6-1037 TaxID=1265861 RepID=W7CMW6_9LIST|nr:hypothetical protein [Brochothrix campestris]EUJ36991.1 hypothetical protein BCAMP_10355 [Brochothrix campestris FSL F6-1037]